MGKKLSRSPLELPENLTPSKNALISLDKLKTIFVTYSKINPPQIVF
jgi:hypothetical protein